MFEKITFRNQNTTASGTPIDIGLLLECMIFYKKVTVVANQTVLKQLITVFGFESLHELIDRNILEILFTETFFGIKIDTDARGYQVHAPIIGSLPKHTFFSQIRKVCVEVTGREGNGRRNAKRLDLF